MGEIVKINLDKTDSKVIHSNETYDVIDNTKLNNLIEKKLFYILTKKREDTIIQDKRKFIHLLKVKEKWL